MWEARVRKFYTQTGGVISPPPDFCKKLRHCGNLDGTLTCVEGKAPYTVNAYLKANETDWSDIVDLPNVSATVEDRQALIEGLGLEQDANITVAPFSRCGNLGFLMTIAKEAFKVGTNSILLRPPGSKYEKGRSKSFQRAIVDYEHIFQLRPALVTAIGGPYIMRCIFPDGSNFALSHSMEAPPAVGSVVMIKFSKLNHQGHPRNATANLWPDPINWNDIQGKTVDYGLVVGDLLCV